MRRQRKTWALVAAILVAASLGAQETESDSERPEQPIPRPPSAEAFRDVPDASYVVTVTEVEFAEVDQETGDRLSSATDLTPLLAEFSDMANVREVRRLSLSVAPGLEASTHVGQAVSVPQAWQTIGRTGQRVANMRRENVGTILSVEVRPLDDDEHLIVKVQYEASRVQDSTDPDTPPATVTVTYGNSLRLRLGQTVIASSHADRGTSLLLVGVHAQTTVFARQPEPAPVLSMAGSAASASGIDGGAQSTVADPSNEDEIVTRTFRPGRLRNAPPASAAADDNSPSPSDRYRRYVEALFARADANGDGVVDSQEAEGVGFLRGRLEFGSVDTNSDGRLTVDELTDVLTPRNQAAVENAPPAATPPERDE